MNVNLTLQHLHIRRYNTQSKKNNGNVSTISLQKVFDKNKFNKNAKSHQKVQRNSKKKLCNYFEIIHKIENFKNWNASK